MERGVRGRWSSRAEYVSRAEEGVRKIEKSSKYRNAKADATPPWANQQETEEIYAKAKMIRAVAGINVAVDHVYPVGGDLVSGLHVPRNLQILTTRENCRKGRKMPGTEADELWSTSDAWTPMDYPEVDAIILRGMLAKAAQSQT